MKGTYISTLDGKTFSSLKEAKKYLFERYIIEKEVEEEIEQIEQKFQPLFPHCQIQIRKSEDREKVISVSVQDPTQKYHNVHFKIQEQKDIHNQENNFKTIQDAYQFYMRFTKGERWILENLEKELSSFEKIIHFEIVKVVQAGWCSDSFHEYHYCLQKENGESINGTVEITDLEMANSPNLKEEIQRYARRQLGSYLDEIEGEIQFIHPKDINDHNYQLEVDGILIDYLLARSKSVEIEITE